MARFTRIAALAVTTALGGTLALATPASATTVISIGSTVIDAKVASKIQVTLTYTCDVADGPHSLNVSVEQTDPQDSSAIAFGSTRVDPTTVVCDGTEQTKTVVVQSKTTNWVPDADGVVVATVSEIGSEPPANADAVQQPLAAAPAPGPAPAPTPVPAPDPTS